MKIKANGVIIEVSGMTEDKQRYIGKDGCLYHKDKVIVLPDEERMRVKDVYDNIHEIEKEGDNYYLTNNGITIYKDKCTVLPDDERMEGGKKYDKGKTNWWLFPFDAGAEIVKVLYFGAYVKGYGEGNWMEVKNGEKRYFAAVIRHLSAHQKGETRDPESGLLHLAHAGCCIIFMIWHELQKGLKQ